METTQEYVIDLLKCQRCEIWFYSVDGAFVCGECLENESLMTEFRGAETPKVYAR